MAITSTNAAIEAMLSILNTNLQLKYPMQQI